ncbi:MAG: 2-hydroxyacid dehydrogenase [Bacillota bacterium]
MTKKVLVTKYLKGTALNDLKKEMEVIMPPEGESYSKKELKEQLNHVDAVLVSRAVITEDLLDETERLKLICVHGVGYDNVDVKAAKRRGIAVANLPDVLSYVTAEFAFALMISLSRRVVEADNYARNHNDHNWHPYLLLSRELRGKKLGIFGLGNIGMEFAKMAQAFQMDIYYHNRSKKEDQDIAKYLSKEELLKTADYISLHIPLNGSTKNFLSHKEFALMKEDVYIINTARGPIINKDALLSALKYDKIAGAALDVHYNEPYIEDDFKDFSNVILTPHIGTTTLETREKMLHKAVETITAFFSGKKLDNLL